MATAFPVYLRKESGVLMTTKGRHIFVPLLMPFVYVNPCNQNERKLLIISELHKNSTSIGTPNELNYNSDYN